MIVFLLSLNSIITTFAVFLFISQIVKSRINIWQTAIMAAVITVPSIVRYFVEWDTALYFALGIVSFPISVIIILCLYEGKIWRRLVAMLYFAFLLSMCDILMTWVSLRFLNINSLELVDRFSDARIVIIAVITSIIFIIFGSLTVFAWRMISARRFRPFFLLYFIMPIGQLVTVVGFFYSARLELWLSGIFVNIIAVLVLLVYTVSQEKKAELEEELKMTRHAMELEQSHYRGVENRREELQKIRHDFNNQLVSIGLLINSGEGKSAQDLIKSLSDTIAGTSENTYCGIPVVNAILTEKAQACEAAGIGFEVDLDLPASLGVEQMHLCSIFGNMLDNAITACKKADSADEQGKAAAADRLDSGVGPDVPGRPVIQLRSMTEGDYLFIKVVNPSGEPPKKPAPGRGYGSRILADFAARYGGVYTTEYAGGMFTVVVSLLAPAVYNS